MSTDLKVAKNPYNEQIMRCSSLKKFPLYPQGVKELREVLHKRTSNLEQAAQVIDRVMAEMDTCPSPRELTELAAEIVRSAEAAPIGCDICAGQPWISVEKVVTDPAGIRYVTAGSKRCNCAKGQWFQMKDRENKAKRDQGLPI